MVLEKTLASGKRFGARYGRRLRHKFAKIEAEQKKAHKCPYCSYNKVKRVAVGIWSCRKCGAKFTGRAYTIPKKIIIKEEVAKEEELKEEKEEEKEKPEEEKPKKYKEKKKTESKEKKDKEEAEKEAEG